MSISENVVHRRLALASILVASLGSSAAAWAQSKLPGPVMKPGLWEATQVISNPASTTKRTVVSQTCYSAEDVASIARVLPQQHEAPLKCRNSDIVREKGGAVTWRIACSAPGSSLAGTGRMELAAEQLTAQASLASKTGAQRGKIEQTISARWVSACP